MIVGVRGWMEVEEVVRGINGSGKNGLCAQWIEHGLRTKGLLVRFPVKAHAWVAGQVPRGSHMRVNHTLLFLSPFLSPSPLNK